MYKVELIDTKTRHEGLSSPELALEKKKERRLTICYISTYSGLDICDDLYGCSWAHWIGNWLYITNMKIRKPQVFAVLSSYNFCNVLRIWECLGHPYL